MHFLPTRCTDEAYVQYVQLFSDCFPKSDKFSSDYLDWLYRCNPDGEVIGFDAFDNDRLIAHYACIPAQAYIGGEKVNVLLSLNTATHPDYQGQGLFLKLAEMTYAAGTEQGYDCVYGIANANSTPGFTRKLMFQLVGTLTAKVGIGAMRINFSHSQPAQFQRIWSKQALEWRCANPINPILTRTTDDRTTFSAPALMVNSVWRLLSSTISTPSVRKNLIHHHCTYLSEKSLLAGKQSRYFLTFRKSSNRHH